MIAIAVRPIKTPMRARRADAFGTARWTGDAGYSKRAVTRHAETMKAPRPRASQRYSGQCERRACILAREFVSSRAIATIPSTRLYASSNGRLHARGR